MEKVFIDSDIILDLIQEREHYDALKLFMVIIVAVRFLFLHFLENVFKGGL